MAVYNLKMAAKILDDILNNFLPLEVVLGWLSNESGPDKENIFIEQYECSQVDFVSHFLFFLREQSSVYFQVYDAETPRKNSQSRGAKISATDNSAFQTKILQDFSSSVNHLDLESLQSFPTLSSCSSKAESERKILESTPNYSVNDSSNKDNSLKKCRRVKLFSETLEGKSTPEKEIEFLDEDDDLKPISENRIVMSTPKPTWNNSFPDVNCINTSDIQSEVSPKLGSKPKWKNHSLDISSPEFNLSGPKSKSFSGNSSHKNKDNKTNCRISLGDFILSDINTSDNKKEKKSKSKKRINPLRLSHSSTSSVNSPFNRSEDFVDKFSLLKERSVCKINLDPNKDDEKEIKFCKNPSILSTESQPELGLVTHTSELKILSQIYSYLINENYCQNIMIELCFIISLLVIQDNNKAMSGIESSISNLKLNMENFFGSIHNCVYFAVEMLWLQRNLLVLLNLSALKLLSENIRIEKFNLELKDFLLSAYSKKQSLEEIKRQNGLIKTGMQGNVSFQYETDNRENFTSDVSFHSFRKQRDLFYNILEIWEANHLASGWVFRIGLGSKIRTLLSISSDPINLLHLSRLFRDQMIMSCCGENLAEDNINEDILQLFPSADPNKILRLRARLTSSPKRQGPCPLPDFTGCQEFYKDFILCTSHSIFHEHLKNSLCDEILRLNDTELTGDIEDADSNLDDHTRERYLQCLNILRLLAKFLGFIVFLPYRGEKSNSDRIFNIHCSVRNNTLPLFDVVSCVKSAIQKRKLTLTIPWMVNYLSMIDPYSANLETYQNVWYLLIVTYKHLKSYKNAKNNFYLKLTLGWFFQLPNLFSDQFYTALNKFNKNSNFLGVSFADETKTGLDCYNFLEESILYAVCPFLNEINVILSENSGCSVKHIRPVTTQENVASKLQASKQLELRLESNFLNNQSSSTRKTVEFVTERVASIAIKHLVHNVIPKIKKAAWSQLETLTTIDMKEAETQSEAYSESCFKELQTVCEKENWEISFKRSEIAIKALLSNELQGLVADTCAKIATRQAAEKVKGWMQSHVTLAMIKKEFITLIRKKFSKSAELNNSVLDASEPYPNKAPTEKNSHHLPSDGRGVQHFEEALPASSTLKAVHELMLKVFEEGSSDQEIEEVIDEAIKTIRHRNDMIPVAEKALFSIIVDLIVIFCILSDVEVSQHLFKKFFDFLKHIDQQNFCHSNLERIICPRNIAMLQIEAKNKSRAWENLGNLLMSLMEANFLTKDQVEAQILSLLRLNWEKEDGVQFTGFISQIMERYSKNNGIDKFTLLLECMLETLNDEEPKSESVG